MAAFRFRAAAALDIRRKQEDAAAAALALSESRLTAARARLDDARARADAAAVAAERAMRAGAAAETYQWHRNWMVGLSAAVSQCVQHVTLGAAAAAEARKIWSAARRRRLMLERLRERAWQRYRAAEHRQELKDLDELARARFATPPAGAERSDP